MSRSKVAFSFDELRRIVDEYSVTNGLRREDGLGSSSDAIVDMPINHFGSLVRPNPTLAQIAFSKTEQPIPVSVPELANRWNDLGLNGSLG